MVVALFFTPDSENIISTAECSVEHSNGFNLTCTNSSNAIVSGNSFACDAGYYYDDVTTGATRCQGVRSNSTRKWYCVTRPC